MKLTNKEKQRILELHNSYKDNSKEHLKNILIEQDLVKLARKFFKTTAKSVDEFKVILRTAPEVIDEIDQFYRLANNIKNLTPMNDLVSKVYHIFNSGGVESMKEEAKLNTVRLLNAYAQLKHNKSNFKEVKDMVVPPKTTPKTDNSSSSKTPPKSGGLSITDVLGENLNSKLSSLMGSKYTELKNLIEKLISNSNNFIDVNGVKKFVSQTGWSSISFEEFKNSFESYLNGKLNLDSFLLSIPRNLKGGEEFRTPLMKLIEGMDNTLDIATLPPWVQSKIFNIYGSNGKSTMDRLITDLIKKTDRYRYIRFDERNVKVKNKFTMRTIEGENRSLRVRNCLELELPGGETIIIYESTGTGTPSLKGLGSWSIIPGWGGMPISPEKIKVGHFIKDQGTIDIVKNNPYFAELERFLRERGPNYLGR